MRMRLHVVGAVWLSVWAILVPTVTLRAVTFDLDYDRHPYEAPSWDADGDLLTAHFEAAAEVWGGIIKDSHDIRVQYQWEELDDAPAKNIWHASEKHYFDTNGNGINDSSVERIVNCTIKVDPTETWWVDPSPWEHSEFNSPATVLYRNHTPMVPGEPAYAGSPPDLLEVSCEMTPIAAQDRDLFTTILHEFGHALGLNMASVDVDPPYLLPPEMVWDADVRVHDERHNGDQNRHHIDVPKALMSYNRNLSNRTLPSATDVLVMANFCHWTQIDMPRKDFMHVDGAQAWWDHRLNWTGARVPDAEDIVNIRSGDDVVVHWDAEAKSVTVGGSSSLTITGNQVLRLEQLVVEPDSALRLSWSDSRVEFLDPGTGLAIAKPDWATGGSLEMTNQAQHTFGELTIRHETPGVGTPPRLSMDDNAVLTPANELNLLGGAEANLSNADITVTSHTRAELNLNGTMTLEDGSSVTTRTLDLIDDHGIDPRISVLSGSTFSVTDDGAHVETWVPAGGVIEVRNTGSEFSLANELINRGSVTIVHGGMRVRDMSVRLDGSLTIAHGGELVVGGTGASAGDLELERQSAVSLSGLGSLIRADDIFVSTPLSVDGGARIEADYVRLNAATGDRSALDMTLSGVGDVLTTRTLKLKSSSSHSASILHNSGVAEVGGDLEVEIAPAPSRYRIWDGRLTVAGDLRVRDDARLEMDLYGGRVQLRAVDLLSTGELMLSLDGGVLELDALPVSGLERMTVNLNGGELDVGTVGALTLGDVNVASRASTVVDHDAGHRTMTMRALTVGQRGEGTLRLQAPTTVNGLLSVGLGAGARGELIFSPISEWTVLEADELHVGPEGYGAVRQTNGYVSVDDANPVQIGRGVYRLEGGRLQSGTTLVGTTPGPDASLIINGGRHDVGTLRVGRSGVAATCRLDSGRLDAGRIILGDLRQGLLVQNDGTTDVAGDLHLGNAAGQSGVVQMSDGYMDVGGDVVIGASERGRGVFNFSGGSLDVRGDLVVGAGADSIARFAGYDSLDIAGSISVGRGSGAQADFRIEGTPGDYPTLDVEGAIHVAGGADSRGDFYIVGHGSQGPTLWLRDETIDVGSGGTGTLHMAGGRIRAVRNSGGDYDSYVKIQPGSSLRGYGQVDIPVINAGLVFNDANIPLALMEKVSGDGLYQTLADAATFQSGRIEFWNGGDVGGAIHSDGRISALSGSHKLTIRGPIRGSGTFEAGGRVDTYDEIDVAHLRVSGSLRQMAGAAQPERLELSMGAYTLRDGSLETSSPLIAGTLRQDGGQIRIGDGLTIGPDDGFSVGFGEVILTGGTLHVAGDLQIGVEGDAVMPGYGTLRFTSKDPAVTVEGDLVLTANGTIEAVEGVAITLTGSNVVNTSTDPAAMAGLSSMTLHFAGDGSVLDTFEVAGDPAGGFESNFALDAIHLGLSTRLQLVDRFGNAPGAGEADEALFVGSLAISDAAWLDLNGLDMLVGDQSPAQIRAWIDAGNILPGAMDRIEVSYDPVLECTIVHSAPVPEPTALGLLTLGALAVTRRRSGSR